MCRARIAKTALDACRADGLTVGMLRPITLYPFPQQAIRDAAAKTKAVLTVELSTGQMVDDVDWAVQGQCPVRFFGKVGGNIPTPEDIQAEITRAAESIS